MKNPSEGTSEDLDEQTSATLDALKGVAHEQASTTSGDNPLFRPGQDHNADS